MATGARSRTRKKPVTKTAESTVRVLCTPFKGAEEIEEVEKDVHQFVTETAFVRVEAGQTVNLGDFESLRISVAVTVPCYKEEVEDTTDQVCDYVAERLVDEVEAYVGDHDSGKKKKSSSKKR